jgi:hypothetical protein
MEVKKCFRVILLIGALLMFCYQVQFAVKSIMDPPLMVTTSGTTISQITPPSMYFCPLSQFVTEKLKAFDYDDETDLLDGKIFNQSEGYYRSWGAHKNLTFEQLIRNVIKEAPEDIKYRNKLLPKFFPKFGYCFELDYNISNLLIFPEKNDFTRDHNILLTDKSTRTYFSVNMASQLGDNIRIIITSQSIYSFFVDVEIYEASPEKSNCNPDPIYSYEQCVDEQVHADLKPRINCVLPFLSERDHCQNLSEKYQAEIEHYGNTYLVPYMLFGETKAQKQCLKPCKQQRISVSLRDQAPSNVANSSTIVITFNSNVKVSKEEPSYNWFNFIVDVGSSLGTWVGISAVTLIDFVVNPRATMKELFNC